MEDPNLLDRECLSGSPKEQQLVQDLEQATTGLLWFSESEYPWQIIYWCDRVNLDRDTLLQQRNYTAETLVIVKEFLSFFTAATTEKQWHDEAEKAEVRRYQTLVNLLQENLQDIRVYLVGEIEIDVYILGRRDDKAIAGIATKIVAT